MISVEDEKIQFAANMTHDLRNPLAGIKLSAEVLAKQIHDPDGQQLIQNIVKTSQRLTEMVDYFLKMSRQSGKEECLISFSLRELINEVMDVVTPSAQAKSLTLCADVASDIMVTADRYRCFRVLLNLAENAIKYTQNGHVLIRSSSQGSQVTLEVEDTGIGIAKKYQQAIFTCYTQLQAGSLPTIGIGLGLHLAFLFAQQMEGKLTVKSKKNKGSTFSFSFPSS